jgi:hypothetical protein
VIDALASEDHYAENVRPVLEAVPVTSRGNLFHSRLPEGAAGPVIVSSYNDLRGVTGRPVVFMEHGAGQTYGAGDENLPSYAGSTRRDGVALFLCPSDRVAQLNRISHPRVPSVVVGAPRLDTVWGLVPEQGVVGLAWHWDAAFCPEGRTALPHYESALADLARHAKTIGTAHPRIAAFAQEVYAEAGIEFTPDPYDVYERASVLVADNTSLGWDFIAMDRPVIWCNAPWYRRFISHGMRFWSLVDAGIEIDEPAELCWAVDKALQRDDKHARRMEVADLIYTYRDAECSTRAVAAIMEHVGG